MPFAVLTRDPADAQGYAAALAPLEIVAMPVTHTAPPADPGALARSLTSGGFAAIVVASARGAQELVRAALATGAALPEVWAVGPATRRALEHANIAANQPAEARDGVDLARALVSSRELRGQRVLVPRAEEGRVEPLAILRAAGADVVDVIAYRTLPAPPGEPACARALALLASGQADVTCVFAPSQVAALAAHAGPLGSLATRFCAIGETTAAALRQAGVASVAVAPTPTPEGIAQAVRSVYPPR